VGKISRHRNLYVKVLGFVPLEDLLLSVEYLGSPPRWLEV
jgi:hypothetical protein